MKTLARRSVQTIMNRTQTIDSFFDTKSEKNINILRLSERESPFRQLFIIVFDKFDDKGEVIPFAEIATSSSHKLRYVVKPTNQYPELVDPKTITKIENTITGYMQSAWHVNFH